MSPADSHLTVQCLAALGCDASAMAKLSYTGTGALPSIFPVTELAAASTAVAALAIADLKQNHGEASVPVSVDRRLAGWWFMPSVQPIGWTIPAPWDAIAGDYPCRDGWIRLHTNAPNHRAAAQRVLGNHQDKAAMALAVAAWDAEALETEIVAAGGCAAQMRSEAQWRQHPQGLAVADEPIVHRWHTPCAATTNAAYLPERPLQGIRVLDLTRILAGPIATRFLAGFGADVLRIDPPGWDEPAVAPDVTPGKHCARLNLREAPDRHRFEELLAGADIILHGLRPDALEGLGLGDQVRRRIAPALIDVRLDAYGWSGPWASRRGFDSLVQMSSGIAHKGMHWQQSDRPCPLPVQALDYATGYLMAAAAVQGLIGREQGAGALTARLSLARTAMLLLDHPPAASEAAPAAIHDADYADAIEATSWGPAKRLRPPLAVGNAPMQWDFGARQLGSDTARWQD